MLSIVVPVRNARNLAANCLRSINDTLQRLRLVDAAELIVMDDDSDPADQIPQLLRSFKQGARYAVTALRFNKRQNYSRACALGFSLAKGESVLLVSHDMVLTPPYVRTLLAASALDATYGIVRGTSPHVDMFPQHQIAAPLTYRSYDDIVAFSEYVERCNGLACVEDQQLCGDSFLIARRVIDKIGTMDGRYVGMFGDIDLGLRAQRAGFRLMCAIGAWLHHVGSGTFRDEARKGRDIASRDAEGWQVALDSYQQFRRKWDPALPQEYPGSLKLDYVRLRQVNPPEPADFQPPSSISSYDVELL